MSGSRDTPRSVPALRAVARRGRRLFRPPPPPPKPPPPPRPLPPVTGVRELLRVAPRRSAVADLRINLIVSSVASTSTFGGIQTAIDLFLALTGDAPRRRIISVEPLDDVPVAALSDFIAVTPEDDLDHPSQLVSIAPPNVGSIPVGPNDVFVSTFWPTANLVLEIRRWQATSFGHAPRWFAYLIQDYEPAFYPASALSMLARATYDDPSSTIAIFNTTLLQTFFHGEGIRFPVEYAFEPRIPAALRSTFAGPDVDRTRSILVYGRPSKPRNALPLIVDGLRAWRASYPGSESWSVVSAGEAHPDVDLGDGLTMHALGKLDLASYGARLRETAIGISLMASPHPSYPPLEMAQAGVLVLTNRYADKDLSSWHTNIASLGTISADGIAADLAAMCRRFEADPHSGAGGRWLRPDYLSDDPQFPFADEVSARLREA